MAWLPCIASSALADGAAAVSADASLSAAGDAASGVVVPVAAASGTATPASPSVAAVAPASVAGSAGPGSGAGTACVSALGTSASREGVAVTPASSEGAALRLHQERPHRTPFPARSDRQHLSRRCQPRQTLRLLQAWQRRRRPRPQLRPPAALLLPKLKLKPRLQTH